MYLNHNVTRTSYYTEYSTAFERLITCIAKHLIFDDDLVCVQSLCIHFVGMVLIRKVE